MVVGLGVKDYPWCWSRHAAIGQLVTVMQVESPVHTTYDWELPGVARFVIGLMCWQLVGGVPLGLECGGA